MLAWYENNPMIAVHSPSSKAEDKVERIEQLRIAFKADARESVRTEYLRIRIDLRIP